jgi:hypothetical protein
MKNMHRFASTKKNFLHQVQASKQTSLFFLKNLCLSTVDIPCELQYIGLGIMVFNATFNNISVI